MLTTPLYKERASALPHATKNDSLALLDLIAIDKALVAQGGLREFTKLGWPILNPGRPLYWGWAHDAVSDLLQAFIQGEIRNGIINVPPRMSKSTIGSVCSPVYSWIDDPWLRWLTASYRDNLSTRDSVRSRRLILSPWFQARWGDKFSLTSDQNQKTLYENNKGGYRMAQSVTGGSTGEGGNRIVVDDPHNVKRAESDQERQNALDWWSEEMSTRLDNLKEDGKLIIMQRLHEKDLTGYCLSQENHNYVHLCLPMEFVPEKKCVVDVIGFKDPRVIEDELLEPERFPRDAVDQLIADLGPYSAAGQLQQEPAPRKGAMFDVDLIPIIPTIPANTNIRVRYWDKAGTDKAKAKGRGAHTAGVSMGRITQGPYKNKFLIMDVVRGQWAAGKREAVLKNTATKDGKTTKIYVEQEPGSGGKESAENTVFNLAGYHIQAETATGSKEVRAEPLSHQVEVGNVILLQGEWNESFLNELRKFPNGAQKDQVDGASGAFNRLAKMGTGGFTW